MLVTKHMRTKKYQTRCIYAGKEKLYCCEERREDDKKQVNKTAKKREAEEPNSRENNVKQSK